MFNTNDHKTGEKIQTPRGAISLVDLTAEQMRAQGFSLWFEHEDYYMMGDGYSAYAVRK